jgi:hypothetical protein
MIASIGRCMRQPLSAPPGKSGRWLRRTPIICVALIYAVWLATTLITYIAFYDFGEIATAGQSVVIGGLWAYGVAGVLLMLLPAAMTASVLAHERDRGTMEALVLTPVDRERLSRGRFWCAAWPWLRVFLWLLPVYLCLSIGVSGFFGSSQISMSGTKEYLGFSVAYVFVPKFYACMFAGMGLSLGPGMPCWELVLTVLRISRDMIDVMVALGISYYFSARMRRGVHAMLLSMVTVPACMLTLFLAPEWAAVLIATLAAATRSFGGRPPMEVFVTLYALGGIAVSSFELWFCFVLLRRVSRRFDEYAVGAITGL